MTNPYLSSLFQEICPAKTVITPNRRLSATLHKLYHQYQIEQKNTCWQTPDILPAATWIQRLWHEYTNQTFFDAPLLLNAAQEHYLFESIIAATKNANPLLQISETADITKSAWNILKQWQINLDEYRQHIADEDALYHWSTAFQKICHDRHWLDNASLIDRIIEKIHSKVIPTHQQIILFGFTELTPQFQHLIETYANVTSAKSNAENHTKKNARIGLNNTEDEIITMARFAKKILAEHPTARIGCVVPTLDKIRDRVLQLFTEILNGENFNLSAGKALIQCPIIHTALQLLSLHKKNIPLATFSQLLTSPFIGHAESERIKRANFDNQLRKNNITTIRLPYTELTNTCPRLAKKIANFFAKIDLLPKEQSYADWAHTLSELLITLGWPGERCLNSKEYQIVEHWFYVLEEFATLDCVAKPSTFHQALHLLQKMAAKSIFQPKTPDAPIQVLGLLEAAGLPFDYLWISGMDDISWPPQPKPNPLISKRLQRELNMPHATAERELLYCKQLMQQFNQNANTIIFSHALQNDYFELEPSPLIRHLPNKTLEQLKLESYQSPAEIIFQTKIQEVLVDEMAPAFAENTKIQGGVNILKQQALCPFKAFAEMRLYARSLDDPLLGLRPQDRGSIVHKVFEILWNTLKDHTTLCCYNENDLKLIVMTSINEALNYFATAFDNKPQYLKLEQKRLYKLTMDWLQIEKERAPYKVLMNEKTAEITLNQLSLTVRIDRVDELENGKKLIIDYKTGRYNDINSWFGERPEEPQLPLYALIDPDNTIGITFAQIYPGKNGFKGLSHYSLNIKGITANNGSKEENALSWQDQLTEWRTTLSKLSMDFYLGVARVDPKDTQKICPRCTLKSICRINEIIHHDA